MKKSIPSFLLLATALFLSSCANNSISSRGPSSADRNGDGIVDASENIQYTRALDIAQNGTNQNPGDINNDGIVDDLEYSNWKNRQQILGTNTRSSSASGMGDKALNTLYKGVGLLNMARGLGGF